MAINKKQAKAAILLVLIASLLAGCATKTSYYRLDPSLNYDIRNIEGFQYVPLTKLCDVYGLNCKWDTVVRTATITSGPYTVILRAGSDRILINGVPKKVARPVMLSGGAVFVPVSFAKGDLAPLLYKAAAPATIPYAPEMVTPKKFSIRTIVLDTGHGGKDAGAVGRAYGTKEKDMALALSKKIKDILEGNGIRVIMTRADDRFLSLQQRADIANNSKADLFISVHINASKSRLMQGFECYHLSNATDDNARALEAFEDSSLNLSESADAERSSRLDKTLWDMALTENRMESGELAGYICKSVEDGLVIKNRGVRTARFFVLKHTHIPSVLVEAGYLSNRYEEAKLKQPQFLDRLAEAIARGILRYKDRYEQTEGFTNV